MAAAGGADGHRRRRDGGGGDDIFVGNGGTDNVGGGAGSSIGDTILVAGTEGADTFNLSLSATGQLIVSANGIVTTYANFVGGPIASSGIEQVLVQGFAGNDSLTVNSTNGAIPIQINFEGGDNADLLTLTGKSQKKLKSKRHYILVKYSVGLSAVLYLMREYLDWQASRRMVRLFNKANLPFIVWVSWVCVLFMYGFFLLDAYVIPLVHTPILFHSVNRNQLAVFLVANLMTGLINMSLDTLSYSNPAAFTVVALYMFVAGLLAVAWNEWNITIKL